MYVFHTYLWTGTVFRQERTPTANVLSLGPLRRAFVLSLGKTRAVGRDNMRQTVDSQLVIGQ